jgi:hypothetical protein
MLTKKLSSINMFFVLQFGSFEIFVLFSRNTNKKKELQYLEWWKKTLKYNQFINELTKPQCEYNYYIYLCFIFPELIAIRIDSNFFLLSISTFTHISAIYAHNCFWKGLHHGSMLFISYLFIQFWENANSKANTHNENTNHSTICFTHDLNLWSRLWKGLSLVFVLVCVSWLAFYYLFLKIFDRNVE